MSSLTITTEDLVSLKYQVVIVTDDFGSSSGIGLETAKLLLTLEASVVGADLQPPAEPLAHSAFTFVKTNVAAWDDLLDLFKKTKELHGRYDHVFVNAGISGRVDYLASDLDEKGNLKEPNSQVLDVNLKAAINTSTLAFHHIRQQAEGGSVVIACSMSSISRFRAADYAAAKHGVFGFMRAMRQNLVAQNIPIHINGIGPSWTSTGLTGGIFIQLGVLAQSPEAVARGAAILMADKSRHGHLLHIANGKYKEVDEAILLPAYEKILDGSESEDETYVRLLAAMK
ncbi:hypothetical protein LCI18_011529 [Fusarium solani-melongenae]|uniref:Uncharacterized protein n=1 Tax=Fusarium solani subsp. cucurbitae TaxID=2747967 RepID=A0ACD3ZH32_FUSSC|nr:hypothetical protein LCI18_011529 [Fusarium solani-melongenae]